jgi:hypothetical protein
LSPSQFNASHNRRERFACLASGEEVQSFRFIPVNYLVLLRNSFKPQQLPQRMLMQFTIYIICFETNNYLLWPHLVLNDILLRVLKYVSIIKERQRKRFRYLNIFWACRRNREIGSKVDKLYLVICGFLCVINENNSRSSLRISGLYFCTNSWLYGMFGNRILAKRN